MNVSLRQIRSFVAVARCGSFTLAANSLHISQPALSVQIHELEKSLGLKLFDRTSRAVHLTPFGRELVPRFMKLLDDLDAILDQVQERAAGRHEIIRIACVPSIAATVLPKLIADFRCKRPLVDVALKDVVWKARPRHGARGGGRSGHRPSGRRRRRFQRHQADGGQDACGISARHPLARVRRLTLDEVSRYPLVLTARTVMCGAQLMRPSENGARWRYP